MPTRGKAVRISRRELAVTALGAALAPAVQSQTPPDFAKTIRDAQKRNSDTLSKFEVPIATEPAFQFKA